MTHLLEVRNLTTRFHTEEGIVHAVNGISYTLDEGESLGIVGEIGGGTSYRPNVHIDGGFCACVSPATRPFVGHETYPARRI